MTFIFFYVIVIVVIVRVLRVGQPALKLLFGGFMAKVKNTAVAVMEIAKPIAEKMGFSLWDITFVKEGPNYFLRIFLDSENGISIEDCERFSREIDPIIEEGNLVAGAYFLEVCSSGIERDLTALHHYEYAKEKEVRVKFIVKPEDGEREFSGILKEFDKEFITIECENSNKKIEIKKLAFAKVLVEKPGGNDE